MKNGNMIQVLAASKFTGSCSQHRRPEFTGDGFELLSAINADESMVITVTAYAGYCQKYRIKPTTDLIKVTEAFSKSKKEDKLRFLFEGQRINRGDTAETVRPDSNLV
jgi:hypothetical protein